jgi:hypothetical protein
MGRNRTPTAIMDARGSFIANPRYARPDEPQGDRPLGGPPKWLSKEEKAVWKDLAKQMLPGVVFFSDRGAFELLVRLTHKLRTQFATMKGVEMGQFIALCSRFAATPSDRSKVAVEQPKESSLSKFLQRRTDPVQ